MIFNKNSDFVSALRQIQPDGNTALRDSVGTGVNVILQMNKTFAQQGIKRKYLHIVLTDGEDNSSKLTFEQLAALFLVVGKHIPKEMITTHFIGVDLNPKSQAVKELMAISYLGQDTSQFHLQSTTEISNIFNKISAELSIERQRQAMAIMTEDAALYAYQESYQPKVTFRVSSYFVLFNLDISGSMSGNSWTQVCNCIQRFVNSLGTEDILCAVLFNDKVHVMDLDQHNYGLPSNLVYNSYSNYTSSKNQYQTYSTSAQSIAPPPKRNRRKNSDDDYCLKVCNIF